MNNEKYLRVCGWTCEDRSGDDFDSLWTHPTHRGTLPGTLRDFTFAEAVEQQLADDRARYNFVRERSWDEGGLLTEAPAECWPTTRTPS